MSDIRRASVHSSSGQRTIKLCASCQAQAERSQHIKLCRDCRNAIAPVVKKAKEQDKSYTGTVAVLSAALGAVGTTIVTRNLVAALRDEIILR